MKRKILALATALALALSLSVCVSAAGQQAGSWTKLSDGYTADTPGTQPTAVPLPDKDTYAITDWVDADHALCTKSLGDKENAFVVVGRDGSEVTLQFATPTAQIIAAKAGHIAYTNQANDTVYVGRFDGKAALTPVLEEKLGGTLRTRSVQAFNADASKLALVYVPNGTANARNAKLFDLTGGTAKTLSAPQAKADILEVSWLSNGALKVVVEAQGDQPVYTTWQYSEAAQPPAGSDLALAQQLNRLGLFRGAGTNADGSVNYDLDRQPNRAEGITMLVRALGAGDQEGTAKNHPYTDVPSWANGVVSYAQKKGLTKGVSATKFGARFPRHDCHVPDLHAPGLGLPGRHGLLLEHALGRRSEGRCPARPDGLDHPDPRRDGPHHHRRPLCTRQGDEHPPVAAAGEPGPLHGRAVPGRLPR